MTERCDCVFAGREKELARMRQQYWQPGNGVIILYGREGIGKTCLVRKFVEDKPFVYYQAREWSEAEQNRHLDEKKKELLGKLAQGNKKVCFILDEFDLMQKGYKNFFDDFAKYAESFPEGRVFLVLCSSSIQWVENSMVRDMGELAGRVNAYIKLKEFTFMEMVERFPESTTEECVMIYSILGGVPAYLDLWNPRERARKNIIRLILDNRGAMHKEAGRFLKTSLRELSYYNTILSVLAEDEPKLNQLYKRTGFSRAKISVYIKNLIQIDVAAKIFSYEPADKASAQKGLYEITDSYLQFYYKLIYPHLSELHMMQPEDFYSVYLKNKLDDVVGKAYIKVCREFLELMNRFGRLPDKFGHFGSFYGKNGFIPLIAESEKGGILAGTCQWSTKPMGMQELEQLLENMKQTGREADYYYLFSRRGFTAELDARVQNMNHVFCIDIKQM